MPTTTTQAVVDGMAFGDSVAASSGRLRLGGPADRVDFGEHVAFQFTPARNRVAVTHPVSVSPAAAAAGQHPRGGGDSAAVAHRVAFGLSSYRPVTEPLTPADSVSYYIASPSWVNPAVHVPAAAGHLTLLCEDHGGTVVLRKPDFGDVDAYEAFRVSRRSRGGDVQIYQDPMWPTTETLAFKFSYLDPTPAEALLVFLKASAGARVTLTDHYGRVWVGFITTPAGDVVQDKRKTKTAAFKFQVAP